MTHYRENKACQEARTPKDIFNTFTEAEQKAYTSMTKDELNYLLNDCKIYEYRDYLRAGREQKVLPEDFPILVIQGTPLQLLRYKLTLMLSLIDFQGKEDFYPSNFSLGEDILEELRKFPGIAFIKIQKETATSEGLDIHRSELINAVLANRRDLFNPSVVLAEEITAGKFAVSNDLIKVITLDSTKLSGGKCTFNNVITSRKKDLPTKSNNTTQSYNTPTKNTYTQKSSYNSYGKKQPRNIVGH